MNTGRLTAIALASMVISATAAQSSPPAIIEQVAFVGDPAPGIPGATIDYLTIPWIDAEGNVLLLAWLQGPGIDWSNDLVLYYGQPGDMQNILRESDPAPDLPEGVVISDLLYGSIGLSELGWLVLTPEVSGPGIEPDFNDRVLYAGPPDDLQKVIQAGDQAPGCEPTELIQPPFGGRLSDNNTLWIAADLTDTGYHPDHAHWIGTRDSFELAVRRGMTFPGWPSGTWFLSAGADIVFNDIGQIAFNAIMSGPATERISYDSRWIGQPGYLQWISYDDEPVQGMPEGVTWHNCGNGSSTTNASGELTEVAYIEGPGITDDNEYVLFFGDSEEIHLVAQEGDPAPEAGPDVYMDCFGNSRINNRHEMFYNLSYRGEGITESNRQAMYFGKLHQGTLELRDDSHAPTFPEDVTLRQVVSVQSLTAMNDVGDIVCATQIQGGDVTDDNNEVLWLRHRILKRWIPLLRSGDAILGRTILADDEDDIGNGYNNHTGGADGKPQSLNDSSELAIMLKFTDGTRGIVRISPPVFGDSDEDLDVDAEDWLAMSDCCMGLDVTAEPDCEVFDLDADGDVDLVDQSMFQQLFTGG